MIRTFALGGYDSCMNFDQSFGNSHSQTKPSIAAADIRPTLFKWLKQPVNDFRGHPDAVVFELQNQATLGIVRSRDGNMAPGRTELGGIVQDITKDLLQAGGVGL